MKYGFVLFFPNFSPNMLYSILRIYCRKYLQLNIYCIRPQLIFGNHSQAIFRWRIFFLQPRPLVTHKSHPIKQNIYTTTQAHRHNMPKPVKFWPQIVPIIKTIPQRFHATNLHNSNKEQGKEPLLGY